MNKQIRKPPESINLKGSLLDSQTNVKVDHTKKVQRKGILQTLNHDLIYKNKTLLTKVFCLRMPCNKAEPENNHNIRPKEV